MKCAGCGDGDGDGDFIPTLTRPLPSLPFFSASISLSRLVSSLLLTVTELIFNLCRCPALPCPALHACLLSSPPYLLLHHQYNIVYRT